MMPLSYSLERTNTDLFLRLTRASFDTAAIGMFWFLPDGRFFRVNPMSCLMTGYSEQELLSLSVPELTANYSPESWADRWRDLREKKHLRYESRQRHKDGHLVPTEIDVSFVEFEGKEFGVGFARDISERKRYEESLHSKIDASKRGQGWAEKALRDASERFDAFMQNSRTAFWVTATDCHTIEYASPVFLKLSGFEEDALIISSELWHKLVHPADQENFQTMRQEVGRGIAVQFKYRIVRPDGQVRWILSHAFPVKDAQGAIQRLAGLLEDVTEHEEANRRLSAALAEREVLIHEIHHRVKNNLQIISSLLSLQGSTAIPDVVAALQESRNRVMAIAQLYETLHQSQDLSRVRFSAYAKRLVTDLIGSSKLEPGAIDLTVEAEPIELDPQKAVLCGLILNELVVNSIRHAFPEGQLGKIEIQLREKSQEAVVLIVRDNGVGLPPELNIQHPKTLGLKLVQRMTRQLKGAMSVSNGNGLTVSIEFPLAHAPSRRAQTSATA